MSRKNQTIAVLGGGSFGTVLSHICATNGYTVKQWVRSKVQAEEINTYHTNHRYMQDVRINPDVKAVTEINQAIEGAHLVFIAIPSQSFRSVVQKIKVNTKDKIIISTTKGIEAETFNLMSNIIEEELPFSKTGALSGPNLAKELVRGAVTATVIASRDPVVCQKAQEILQSAYFRVYASEDPVGVQLGGALKNIYAIAAGIASALKMGDNSRSMLITRALAEMSRFSVYFGANPMTFLGLAGVGDLTVTCTSALSRNFSLGAAIGEGFTLSEAITRLDQVAEGVNTLKLVKKKAEEKNIYMPITHGLYSILFEGTSIKKTIRESMLSLQTNDVDLFVKK